MDILSNYVNNIFSLIVIILLFLFTCGLFGATLENKNFLLIFLCLELINASIICLFSFIGIFHFSLMGFIYSLVLLSVAASESAIGLSLLINYHFVSKNSCLSVKNLNFLKG